MSIRPLILCAAAFFAAAAPASAVPAKTQTVKLLTDTTARAYPGEGAKKVAAIEAVRPLTNKPTVLPVIDTAKAEDGTWYRVRLPKRPNGSTGWVSGNGTVVSSTAYRVVINRSARKATLYKKGRAFKTFRVVIGAKSTPTPAGNFFITENVRQPDGAYVGPYVLATSAYSNVLQEFAGGPGQIGLHGRTGLSDPLGTAASHGCIRFADKTITYLNSILSPGVPVDVR